MTEPKDDAPPIGTSELETYVRENRASFTEDVLRREALAAGHPPDAVEAALAATRSAGVHIDRGRITRRIFFAYLATFVILTVLMLVNPANQRGGGFLGDVRGIGVIILSMALAAAFVASLVWVASRRVFWVLVGVGIAIASLPTVFSPGVSVMASVVSLVGAVLGAALAFAAARMGRTAAPASPSTELLMIMPLLLLLAIGGTCVVSGLPIPRPV